ncbi:MAG: uracil-DNA glycosylase [Burkholderiales bacterium]|nr:uracil-DNA glycosylase [Burkholderiales bacterium]
MVSKGGQDLHVQPLIHKPTVSANADSAWDDEVAASPAPAPSAAAHEVADVGILNERAAAIAQMDWVQLQAAVAQCTACALCKGRKQAVFGVGDQQAQWLLVGEGPGRTEDAQGEPFVGKSGKLLDNMLASLGLKRGQNVYIANIVKCRPSDASGNDRPPSAEEASACRPFLERQIALLQPKLMLALGKTAAVSLLQRDPQTAVASLRGRVQQVQMRNALAENIAMPVVVTYHPAYLLRKPGDKAKAWADLCLAQQQYAQA